MEDVFVLYTLNRPLYIQVRTICIILVHGAQVIITEHFTFNYSVPLWMNNT
jgi:hypothetical protein